jgi:hypothetical protein
MGVAHRLAVARPDGKPGAEVDVELDDAGRGRRRGGVTRGHRAWVTGRMGDSRSAGTSLGDDLCGGKLC